MLSSAAQLLVLDDSDDDDDTSLTTAYVGVVVRVQGLGRGWLVRKNARLAKNAVHRKARNPLSRFASKL